MKNLAITNIRLFNGKMDSVILPKATILIEWCGKGKNGEILDGKISQIGQMDKIPIPKDYKIVDLNGKFVIPGLINVHCHFTANGEPMTAMQGSERKMKILQWFLRSKLGKRYVKKQMRTNIQAALNSGVTTIRNAGDPEYYDIEVKKEIDAGKIAGPRIVCAGRSICVTGGHGGVISHIIDGPWEGRKAVRDCLRHESDVIKILSTGGVTDSKKIGEAGRPQMTTEEIAAICDEAHRAGVKVMTHCESTVGIREALLGGVDSIEHGAPITDDLINLFKNNPKSLNGYTTLVSTISAAQDIVALGAEVLKVTDIIQQNGKIILEGMIEGLHTAVKHDIPMAMGTDAAVPFVPHYEFWRELVYYQHFAGISNKRAINIATEQNAKLLGVDEVTGTLEVGKSADFVVYDGNPLEDLMVLEKPVHVVYRGNLIKNPSYKKIKEIEKYDSKRFFSILKKEKQ
ncbi:MAG: amidohydrolase family protein [Promethearchaeota archaeon]|nr:MAG: amidohydrolase family protein [Candidatus Lokiarchaeota archaeon]